MFWFFQRLNNDLISKNSSVEIPFVISKSVWIFQTDFIYKKMTKYLLPTHATICSIILAASWTWCYFVLFLISIDPHCIIKICFAFYTNFT